MRLIHTPRRSMFARSILAGVAAGTMVLASSALAQPGGGGGGGGWGGGGGMTRMMGDLFSPPVTVREIDLFVQVAGLSTDQTEAAKTLLEGYQEQFREQSEKVRATMDRTREAFRESRDPSAWAGLRTTMQEFRTRRGEMEKQFFADFQQLLTPEQVERWPRIERAHRRSQTSSRGFLSGERVDLVRLVEQSKLPAEIEATLIPTLTEYEESLDRELIARNKAYDDVAEAFTQAQPGEGFAKAQELIVTGREASVRVRDVNRRYAKQLLDMLPDEVRPTFEESFKRASYPEVYRPTLTRRQIDAALGFEDLETSQKESLAALAESHTRSLASINDRLAAEISKREESFDPAQMGQRFRRGQGGGGGGGGGRAEGGAEEAVDQLRAQRRELEETTAERVKAILSPTQIERLPKEEEQNDRGGRGERRRAEERPRT